MIPVGIVKLGANATTEKFGRDITAQARRGNRSRYCLRISAISYRRRAFRSADCVLGEDFFVEPPEIRKSELSDVPHLGAASIPFYRATTPSYYSGRALKGWA